MRDEVHRLAQPLAIDAECRMHVEAAAAGGAGGAGRSECRIAVAHIDHPRQVPADERLERSSQLHEIPRQIAIEDLLRVLDRSEVAGAAQQGALGSRLDHHVGDQPGEQDVVGADGEQDQVEAAVGAVAAGDGQVVLQLGDLRANRPGTRRVGSRHRTLAGALAVEKAAADGGAGAAQRNEGDRQMMVLHRERQRRAHLIAVERAVTGSAHPARALARPVARSPIVARNGVTRLVAAEPGSPGTIVLAALEAPEAEALVGQPHRPVGIAFTGRNRVAHSGNEHVAHLDLADDALGSGVGQHDVDADDGDADRT